MPRRLPRCRGHFFVLPKDSRRRIEGLRRRYADEIPASSSVSRTVVNAIDERFQAPTAMPQSTDPRNRQHFRPRIARTMPHLRQCGAIVAVRYTSIHLWGQEDVMLTLRTLAIVITGAGVFAGLPLTGAQACDDDRYPCPMRVPQETADAPIAAAPSAPPQKKASHPARSTAKAQAKPEREAPRAAARAKPIKPAAQEQAAEPISQKGAEAAPAMVASPAMVAAPAMVPPPADQSLNDASRGESPVAAAATAWPARPATEGAGTGAPAAPSADTTNAVTSPAQVVDPNEVNDLDRAAAASAPAESSWLTYLLLILATALAAASAFWLFFRTASPFARREPRMQ